MSRTLVIGANGTVGSELVRLLRAAGHQVVKATSRPVTDPATEVHLNLLTRAGLDTALQGVSKLFLLSPPGHTNQDELLKPVIDVAKAHGVQKVVLMTAMGANADDNAPLRKAERHLEASGLAYNIIRPNWFMQNFNSYWIQGILEHGKIFLPVGKAKGSFIDARDIAAVAARLLGTDEFNQRDFDLTGAVALDHDAVAAILSQATGQTITYQDIPEGDMRAALLQAGLPAAYTDFMMVILGFFKAGYAERTTDAVHMLLGRAPISLEQYAADYRSAWVKA
ncbi:SDR family oxidoreductase [Curvibacter sp. APW13]|uniref:SDR family oxidoreductase n=1 Tax=Curvibacter sp. APW13 TaxID=3077236 RepID=UPI0028DE63AC|nr:SDR family oxidoreductase [Curvibacter sp. APW13]MDT8989966.1 SDR family oxidoreductase [Curvibacter sp. APW13]